ncbi:MAG: hypothetical protein C0410_12930 [Anaerolinea sp.]|nr:hypothetical protein [Anaerolinea sp.]
MYEEMKVSVVVTSFNQKNYLAKAIESLLNQTVRPYEIIICDDCSIDGSRELICEYASRYPNLIKFIIQDRNVGPTRNRNAGLRAASGNYVTTLDGDDRYLPEKIEREIQAIKQHGVLIAYSNVFAVDAGGRRMHVQFHSWQQIDGCLFEPLATFKMIAPRDMLVARRCLEEIGFQDESFLFYEDDDYALRLASRFPFAACRQPLIEHTHHPTGAHNVDHSAHLEPMIRIAKKALNVGDRNNVTLDKPSTKQRFETNFMLRHHVHLQAIIRIAQRALDICDQSITPDKSGTKRRIEATLKLFEAKKAALEGDIPMARALLYTSLRLDMRRSISYDLLMRLLFPGLFVREPRLYDSLAIGPLALSYYLLRGIWKKK